MDRQISVKGSEVTYHSTKYDPTEVTVNFGRHLGTIESVMGELVVNDKPRLIAIEGPSGSGKTGLAHLLKHEGVNVKVIDAASLAGFHVARSPVDISDSLQDTAATYVIDEVALIEPKCFPLIKSMVDNGSTVVLLMQSRLDIDFSFDAQWLKMDRTGLSIN